jgi:hypothetical protein
MANTSQRNVSRRPFLLIANSGALQFAFLSLAS